MCGCHRNVVVDDATDEPDAIGIMICEDDRLLLIYMVVLYLSFFTVLSSSQNNTISVHQIRDKLHLLIGISITHGYSAGLPHASSVLFMPLKAGTAISGGDYLLTIGFGSCAIIVLPLDLTIFTTPRRVI
ncbi:hypothetical protein ACJX0J_031584, partial [Zea mays]